MTDQDDKLPLGEFAKLLRKAREPLKLTQAQVANLIKVRETSVRQWESNKSRLPTQTHLEAIANAYQIPLKEVMEIWESEKAETVTTNPLASTFKEARLRLGLKQSEVANQLGVRQEAVSHWERPGGSPPGQDRIEAVAKLYQLDLKELENGRKINRNYRITHDQLNFEHGIRPLTEGRPLPCFTTLPVDFSELRARIINAVDPQYGIRWRMISTSCSERSFFYQLKGASLEPRIPDGAWVAFDPDRPRPMPGDVILMRVNDTYLMGILKEDQGRKFLAAENPVFTGVAVPIQSDLDILAVGIEVQIPLISVA
jgi:transcriptional regulator with XRE-family HTH domain